MRSDAQGVHVLCGLRVACHVPPLGIVGRLRAHAHVHTERVSAPAIMGPIAIVMEGLTTF